jgi:hypothetical protein
MSFLYEVLLVFEALMIDASRHRSLAPRWGAIKIPRKEREK